MCTKRCLRGFSKSVKKTSQQIFQSIPLGIFGGSVLGCFGSLSTIYAAANSSEGWKDALRSFSDLFSMIYSSLVGISTLLLVFVIAVNILRIMVSPEAKTVQSAKEWISRTVKAWLCLSTLGYFVSTAFSLSFGGGPNMQQWVDQAFNSYSVSTKK